MIPRIPTDDDNRLIITIKFGLVCVKPYLIMLTKNKTQEMIYQILQFCSLTMISYLTYSKIYYKNFASNLRNNKSLTTYINTNKYIIYHKFTSTHGKYFGMFYLISYIIANFTSYFILIMLVECKPLQNNKSSFKSQWMLLVYIPYVWLFFSKLYHNEVVKYFKNLNIVNTKNNLSAINKFKIESRIDTVVFWLKMLVFTSLLCFTFCVKQFLKTSQENGIFGGEINSLWFIQLICTWCIFVNSLLTLSCFECAN